MKAKDKAALLTTMPIDERQGLLKRLSKKALAATLAEMKAADRVASLASDKERADALAAMPPEEQAGVLAEMAPEDHGALLASLDQGPSPLYVHIWAYRDSLPWTKARALWL
jgi:flagellar motility protein MotE (MotC chaperone)